MRDWLTILTRLHWIWSRRYRYPHTPLPWWRCHCGALADIDLFGQIWCMPCKYAAHDTCECSNDPEPDKD